MDQEWGRDGFRAQGDVHRWYTSEKGLCTYGNHRWEIHQSSHSIRTETFVVGSYRTPWSPFFVSERVPCEGKGKLRWFKPVDDARGVERPTGVLRMNAPPSLDRSRSDAIDQSSALQELCTLSLKNTSVVQQRNLQSPPSPETSMLEKDGGNNRMTVQKKTQEVGTTV